MSNLSICSPPARTSVLHEACLDKLDALGKQGGVERDTRTALQALGGAAFTFVMLLVLRSLGPIDPKDVLPILRPFIPLALPTLLLFTGAGLIFAVRYGFRALRAGSSGSFTVRCPKCATETFSLSAIHKKKFELVCPSCFALVIGSAEAYNVEHQCSYCDLRYFAGPQPLPKCPSCSLAKDRGSAPCPDCKQLIPKGVWFCRSCGGWHYVEYTKKLKDLEVTHFSPSGTASYLGEVTKRLSDFADGLARLLAASTTAQGLTLDVYAIGRIGGSFVEPTEFLRAAALAAEWLARPGVTPPVERMLKLEEVLASLAASLEKLNAANVKLSEEIAPRLQAARDAVAAALARN